MIDNTDVIINRRINDIAHFEREAAEAEAARETQTFKCYGCHKQYYAHELDEDGWCWRCRGK